jgi:TonB family protein
MATKPAPSKILRIGIIQSGKIIEERLLRSQQAVTIGQSTKNTFVIPVSNLPNSATLFDVKRGSDSLAFKDGMDGRVSLEEDGVLDFASLKSKGVAKKAGDSWNVGLTEKSRGKVVLGDVTLLFQFVTPPPPAPKLQLPAAAKGGWVKSIEWHFVTILLLSALFQAGPTMFLVLKDWPVVDPKTAKIPDRFIDLLVPDKVEEPPPEETTTDVVEEAGDKPTEKKAEKKVEQVAEKTKVAAAPQDAETKARAAAAKKRELAKKVQNNSLLKFIGAKGAGGGSGSVADALAGGAARSKIDEAFNGATGVATAEVGQDRSRRGGGAAGDAGGEAVGIGDLKSKRTGAKVSTGAKKKEVKVKAKVSTKGPSSTIGTGKLAKDAIASVVKRRIRSVQACYERELKKNPNLAGKVTVQFTIGTVGRVTSAKITVNTTKSAAVGKCIKQRIGLWRFPKPQGGAVTVAYPFVFTASR